MMILKRLFADRREPPRAWSLPEGKRAYAIGDIHGRSDLLDELLAMIEADERERGPAETSLVFLGDYVDRGPDSRGVIDRLIALEESRGGDELVFLMGNHEEVFLMAAEGDTRAAGFLHRIGGRETLLSYGVGGIEYEIADAAELVGLIQSHVPSAHIEWLRRLRQSHRMGDYLFVHAGIRPNVPIEEQSEADLRWIREEFLQSDRSHGVMVVHGHSIAEAIECRPNRIGVDTGAYRSGRLSAVGLEGETCWFIQTGAEAEG